VKFSKRDFAPARNRKDPRCDDGIEGIREEVEREKIGSDKSTVFQGVRSRACAGASEELNRTVDPGYFQLRKA